jgi:hypothetical protein
VIVFGAWAYLSLIILSIAAISLGYWKYRNRLLFVHYLAVSGAILFFDYLICVWGKAYKYYPGVIDGKYDPHIGALVNAQVLPSFAILYIAFNCKWYWSIIFSAFFTGIELLFKQLGVYKGFWWQECFTFVLLITFFPIAKLWWRWLTRNPPKWLSFLSILAIFYVIFIQLNVLLYGVLQLRTIHVEWIERLNRDGTTINSPISILFGSALTFLILKNAPASKCFLLVVTYLILDILLKAIGVVKTEQMVFDTIFSLLTFLIPISFTKYAGEKIKTAKSRFT